MKALKIVAGIICIPIAGIISLMIIGAMMPPPKPPADQIRENCARVFGAKTPAAYDCEMDQTVAYLQRRADRAKREAGAGIP